MMVHLLEVQITKSSSLLIVVVGKNNPKTQQMAGIQQIEHSDKRAPSKLQGSGIPMFTNSVLACYSHSLLLPPGQIRIRTPYFRRDFLFNFSSLFGPSSDSCTPSCMQHHLNEKDKCLLHLSIFTTILLLVFSLVLEAASSEMWFEDQRTEISTKSNYFLIYFFPSKVLLYQRFALELFLIIVTVAAMLLDEHCISAFIQLFI